MVDDGWSAADELGHRGKTQGITINRRGGQGRTLRLGRMQRCNGEVDSSPRIPISNRRF